uniref:Uncharacterized protein n=1 Tax=Amphimedon queenslandica TaxID=400682 RepID=A0A1X7SSK4_AMPQE
MAAASYLNLLSSVSKRLPLLHQPCVSVTRRLFSSEISDLFNDVILKKKYESKWSVSEYCDNLKEDEFQLELLKNLKERRLTKISDEIKYLEFDEQPSGDCSDARNPRRFLYVILVFLSHGSSGT